MLAGALGTLTFIVLGKHVSDAPLALALWAVLGCYTAYVLVGPKKFVHELRVAYSKHRALKLKEMEHERLVREAQRARDKDLAKIYTCQRQYYALNCAQGITRVFWVFCGAYWMFLHFTHENPIGVRKFLLIICGSVSAFVVLNAIIMSVGLREGFNDIGKGVSFADKERELFEKNSELKKGLLKSILGPLWVMWSCLRNLKSLLVCVVIVLARISAKIVSAERWCAVVGAIVGFCVGWTHDRSEVIGMTAGALAGAALYLVAKQLLCVLPSPDTELPELV